ncbi:alpha/beta-hydrolase [Wilcoxina mikolae CBS 423.85]|nr:alpha/beta-hydrolase [Wilcoxina mikolae CBS 423.85]
MSFHHATLNASLTPVEISTSPGILQYRNIKYASIPERFAQSVPINDWNGAAIGSEKHGPRCPQLPADCNTLFRIPPESVPNWGEDEDELECLNLHVTVPEGVKEGDNVPVLMWIYGGSFVVTVGSAESGVCDPTKLVATSIEAGTPIIYVAMNYRLNALGFAHISEEKTNFGLFDQKHAIEWLHRHIRGFGGDPNNITLAGESAGSISTHMHTLSSHSSLLQRIILQSGTANTIPAASPAIGDTIVSALLTHLSLPSISDLRKIPVTDLLRAQRDLKMGTLPPISTGSFWQQNPTQKPWSGDVLIGDNAKEWSLYTTSILSLSQPRSIFPLLPQSEEILAIYGDTHEGVLRFVGDGKFHLHTENFYREFLERTEGETWRYLFDARNPFAPKAGAHHGVELLYLFGGFEMPEERLERVGREMRGVWVKFVVGEKLWEKGKVLLVTDEEVKVVGKEEVGRRRNEREWKALNQIGWEKVAPVLWEVVNGRIRFE